MAEVENREATGAGRRLVLGFDAGCMTCSDLARRIEEQVGDKLEVRSLREPQVEEWRRRALGENAPWAPTLIEIKGLRVRAWTGWQMGVKLSRSLGPVATWKILQVLSETGAVPEANGSDAAADTGVGLTRGQLLKGVAGAATVMSVLPGALWLDSTASRAQGNFDAAKSSTTVAAGTKVEGDRLSKSQVDDLFDKMTRADNVARKLHQALEKKGFDADDSKGNGGRVRFSSRSDKEASFLLIPYEESGTGDRKAKLWLFKSGNSVRGDFAIFDKRKDEAYVYGVKRGEVKLVKKIEKYSKLERSASSQKSSPSSQNDGSTTASTQASSKDRATVGTLQYDSEECAFTNQIGECITFCDICRRVISLGGAAGVGDFVGTIAAATICAAATGGGCAFAVGVVVGALFLAGVTFTGADFLECQRAGFC